MISTLLRRLTATAILATAVAGYCSAAEVSPYTWDFSKEIDVSDHAFKAGSNWEHIVGSYNDYYDTYYMTYIYDSKSGVDGSGCLHAKKQEAGDNWDVETVTDCLVTPPVKGDIKIMVKREDTYSSSNFIKIYEVKADGSLGSLVKSVMNGNIGEETEQWYEVEIASGVEDFKRYALQCQLVYIDNFSATAADIIPQAELKIASVTPSNQTSYYLNQQPDGTIKAEYKVTVTNTGEVPLTVGMENYSITAVNAKSTPVDLFTVAVPQNLGVGETSAEFTVAGNIEASQWSYASAYISLGLRENISGSVVTPNKWTYYNAYEPKFVFRKAGETSTSSTTAEISFGFISESASVGYEIYNAGRAPLTVKSVTLPEGFTSNAPAAEFIVPSGEKQPLGITLSAERTGLFSGNLEIVYVDASGSDRTYTLKIQGNVIGADTWVCDFGSESITYPAGSIADSGISSEASYADYCIYGSTPTSSLLGCTPRPAMP